MGLFNFGKKKQEYEYLLKWQNSILDKPIDKLVLSREELLKATQEAVQTDLTKIKDSLQILKTTQNPDTFFHRLNFLIEVSNNLCRYEPHVEIDGKTPTQMHLQFVAEYQEMIRSFLLRYYSDTYTKAAALKTHKGRVSRFQKWYDSLQEYYCFMNQDNINLIESDYRLNTKSLNE